MRTPLQKNEKILLVTHSSWTALVLPFLLALALVITGILIVIKVPSVWGWLVSVAGVVYWLLRYSGWKVNIWVVTNFRVVDEVDVPVEDTVVKDVPVVTCPLCEEAERVFAGHGQVAGDAAGFWTWGTNDGRHREYVLTRTLDDSLRKLLVTGG